MLCVVPCTDVITHDTALGGRTVRCPKSRLCCGRSLWQWIIWLPFSEHARSYQVRVLLLRYGTSIGHNVLKDLSWRLRRVYMIVHIRKVCMPTSPSLAVDPDCLANDL